MQITLEQLHQGRMTPGWVVVEFYSNTTIKLDNGQEIMFPDNWKQHENTPTFGRVIKICKHADATEWETDVELEEGDEVFFDYKALMYAQLPNTDRLIFVSDQSIALVLIRYEQCYAYFRNGAVHPMNGYMFVQDVLIPKEGQSIALPERYRIDPFRAQIVKIGKPVKYKNPGQYNTPSGVLQPGMVVTIKPYRNQYLRHPMFGSVNNVKRIQDRDILCIDNGYKC